MSDRLIDPDGRGLDNRETRRGWTETVAKAAARLRRRRPASPYAVEPLPVPGRNPQHPALPALTASVRALAVQSTGTTATIFGLLLALPHPGATVAYTVLMLLTAGTGLAATVLGQTAGRAATRGDLDLCTRRARQGSRLVFVSIAAMVLAVTLKWVDASPM